MTNPGMTVKKLETNLRYLINTFLHVCLTLTNCFD